MTPQEYYTMLVENCPCSVCGTKGGTYSPHDGHKAVKEVLENGGDIIHIRAAVIHNDLLCAKCN